MGSLGAVSPPSTPTSEAAASLTCWSPTRDAHGWPTPEAAAGGGGAAGAGATKVQLDEVHA